MRTWNAMMVCAIVGLAVVFAISPRIFGEDGIPAVDTAKKIKPIDMNKADVEKFVKILPNFCTLFKDIGDNVQTSTKSNPQAVAQALVTNAKVGKFAVANGYASSEALMKAYVGVMSAFCYLKMEEMKRSLAKIPPNMAGAMAAQLQHAENMMRKQKNLVTQQTIASVRPHMQSIMAAMTSACSKK